MRKFLIIILSVLFVICSTCAGIGIYYKHFVTEVIPTPPPKQKEVTYKYFLEDVEQLNMPFNEISIDENGEHKISDTYLFSKYSCSNNLTGNFDKVKWEFIPDKIIDSECELYFVKSRYSVEVNVTNGTLDENNSTTVDRQTDGVFKITPNDGYSFADYSCSNNKIAKWDQSASTFTISSVMSDVACNVNFKINQMRMDVTVKNGTGNTTEISDYGSSVSAIVEANAGYEKPSVVCTNGQIATYIDNKIVIEKITNNTACTVTFKKIQPKTYKLIINNMDEGISIIDGSKELIVTEGYEGKITLKALDGYKPVLDCGGITPLINDENPDGSYTFRFMNMNNNITCNVKSQIK